MDLKHVFGDKVRDFKADANFSNLGLFGKSGSGKEDMLSNTSTPSPDVKLSVDNGVSRSSVEKRFDDAGVHRNWTVVHLRGPKPEPRYYHAATVVGRRMLIAGGDTASGPISDVQMLHLGKLIWLEAGVGPSAPSQGGLPKTATAEHLPACRGHSLISWGKTVLLVAGQMDPVVDRVQVWSFDVEMECWRKVAAKGEIPAARSGQSVTRAGSILIMFGGEDAKGHKLSDLHILDLKSLMWLPLHTTGPGPSPRAKHAAAMYDDRFLLIFGGASKSKPLSDVYALDFETMEWSRLKTKGVSPSPRAGHASVLVGDKWYIAGGENRGFGVLETLVLDITRSTWSVVVLTPPNSLLANEGLSMVLVQRKERAFLVAFGGRGRELSNEVQVLYITPSERSSPTCHLGGSLGDAEASDLRPSAEAAYSTLVGAGIPCACVNVAKTHLMPVVEHRSMPRTSPSHSPGNEHLVDASASGLVPLRKQFAVPQDVAKEQNIHKQEPEGTTLQGLAESPWQDDTPPQLCKANGSHSQDVENTSVNLESASGPASPVVTMTRQITQHGGSSRRKDSSDSNLSSVLESPGWLEYTNLQTAGDDVSTQTWRSVARDSYDMQSTVAGISGSNADNSEVELMTQLHDADTVDKRMQVVAKLRKNFERKLAAAVHKNEITEGQLAAVLRSKEEAEKNLSSVLKSQQKAEARLEAALKDQKDVKDRVLAAEQAQEDSNNLCNVVHSENLRLEHDLAFLKAVLEDTQRELHSTREVLAGERSRAFQLQVEVFELKQKIPPLESSHMVSPTFSSHAGQQAATT